MRIIVNTCYNTNLENLNYCYNQPIKAYKYGVKGKRYRVEDRYGVEAKKRSVDIKHKGI